jgi:hypothetical protein
VLGRLVLAQLGVAAQRLPGHDVERRHQQLRGSSAAGIPA